MIRAEANGAAAPTGIVVPRVPAQESARTAGAHAGTGTGVGAGRAGEPATGRRVTVAVYAADPVLHVGVVHQLRQRPEIELVDEERPDGAQVSLVAVDSVDDETVALLRRLRHDSRTRTGLVVGTFESGDALQRAIECGVTAVLRRAEADQDRLLRLVLALAKGEGVLPGDLLARLLHHVGSLQRSALDPNASSLSTLTPREAEMLRLVSEGLDTAEIARKTSYSERTVKNVLHEVITRLQLRNRTHAVGFALRNGLI
ncbi:LuxR C-terminal-related transcriptional regulator [Streptomyces sp. NPDC090025]|uniref:helix-turn-helix transcriptional regulator n=1 Tax=Streptomyces sp. NPDC090025 TaxID=3365922 RepID=UPI003832C28D